MSKFEIFQTAINVATVLIAPIVAVIVGQKLQDKGQKRKDKMEIFRVLMMNRGIGWTADTVRALNIIDVVFSDDDSVRARWKEYYNQLCIQEPNAMQCKQIQEAQDKLIEAKYDSIERVNHINYISHIPSKILDGRYVADFLGLLSALSIKVQS